VVDQDGLDMQHRKMALTGCNYVQLWCKNALDRRDVQATHGGMGVKGTLSFGLPREDSQVQNEEEWSKVY